MKIGKTVGADTTVINFSYVLTVNKRSRKKKKKKKKKKRTAFFKKIVMFVLEIDLYMNF